MVLTTAESILQLIALILAGALAYRLKLIKRESLDSLNAILMHMGLPAVLLRSFQSDLLFNGKEMLIPTLGISVLLQLMSLLLAFVFVRKNPNANIERASIAFTNNAFIGIPLLSSIFGDIGAFYASTFNAISSLVFFSVLPAMISGSFSAKDCIRKTINDKVIICIISIILLFADIRIPECIMTPVGWLADMTTPLATIIIGCIVAYSDFSHMFSLRVIWITFLRMFIVPALICVALALMLDGREALLSFAVLASTPTGSLVTIYTEEAGGNTSLSSGIFLLTTILSAVSIPMIVYAVTAIAL